VALRAGCPPGTTLARSSYRVRHSDRLRAVQDALGAEIERHEVYASR
jgi:hypothetical protein